MDSFPAFFPLAGRRVVIAGEGEWAASKARLFDGSPAEIIRLDNRRAVIPADYAGAALIFVAIEDEALALRALEAARGAGAPVNVVDRPALCDFFTPALVDRGQVVVAVGTGGSSPVLARQLKANLAAVVPEGVGRVAALLDEFRPEMRRRFTDLEHRKRFIEGVLAGPAANEAMAGDMAGARQRLREALDQA